MLEPFSVFNHKESVIQFAQAFTELHGLFTQLRSHQIKLAEMKDLKAKEKSEVLATLFTDIDLLINEFNQADVKKRNARLLLVAQLYLKISSSYYKNHATLSDHRNPTIDKLTNTTKTTSQRLLKQIKIELHNQTTALYAGPNITQFDTAENAVLEKAIERALEMGFDSNHTKHPWLFRIIHERLRSEKMANKPC